VIAHGIGRRLALAACVVAAPRAGSVAAQDRGSVTLDFVVTAPATTPAGSTLYVAGSIAALGGWRPDGVKLARGEDGRHRAHVVVARGAVIEWKVTLGSWSLVEKDASGADVPNRRVVPTDDTTLAIDVAAWGEGARKSTVLGVVETHPGFGDPSGLAPRPIHVWLPPGYAEQPTLRCAVLYMQDGQNVFDSATGFGNGEWRVDETCDRLIRAGAIPPLIVVGIENTRERIAEYTPTAGGGLGAGGNVAAYSKMLVEEVKPFVDEHYRTLPDRAHTLVAGSSLGGLVSLYLARERSDVFGGAAALSPALMWDGEWMRRTWARSPPAQRVRLWIDMGTREADGGRIKAEDAKARTDEWIAAMRSFAALLESEGWKRDLDFTAREIEGARHNEAAWAARFEDVLRFLLPTDDSAVRSELAAYYADLSARDWTAFAGHFWPGAAITTAWQPPNEEAVRVVPSTVEEFVRLAPQGPGSKSIFEERMVDVRITVEGSIAHAWVHYVMKFGEPGSVMEFGGVDSISLLRVDGKWRIAALVFAGAEDPTKPDEAGRRAGKEGDGGR
jgi:predicted alpha/beta superfamily hydrolase